MTGTLFNGKELRHFTCLNVSISLAVGSYNCGGDEFIEMSFTCIGCGKECSTWEEVDTGRNDWEIWCYCLECDVETFHPIVRKENLKT